MNHKTGPPLVIILQQQEKAGIQPIRQYEPSCMTFANFYYEFFNPEESS